MARATGSSSRIDTGLLLVCLILSFLLLIVPGRIRESSAAAIRNTILSPLVQLERQATTIRAAITSRDSVLQVRGTTATSAMAVPAVQEENAHLRSLLGLSARLRQGFVAAEVMPPRSANEQYTITLNVGTSGGVQPFTPVVSADGLVGMVQSADATTSYAILWAHPDFHVSAMSKDEQAFGIVQPHLGTGAERWLLELRGVPFRAKLDSGAVIVTAGLGGVYPSGITIGTVIGEVATTEKWVRTFLIKPAALGSSVGPVLVLLPQRVAQGVNGVWNNVTSADSAAKAVAAAGDSVARKAALAELAARRAAIDSTAADSLKRDSLGIRVPVSRADSLRRDSARRADSIRAKAKADSARLKPPTGPPPPLPRTGPPPPREWP